MLVCQSFIWNVINYISSMVEVNANLLSFLCPVNKESKSISMRRRLGSMESSCQMIPLLKQWQGVSGHGCSEEPKFIRLLESYFSSLAQGFLFSSLVLKQFCWHFFVSGLGLQSLPWQTDGLSNAAPLKKPMAGNLQNDNSPVTEADVRHWLLLLRDYSGSSILSPLV